MQMASPAFDAVEDVSDAESEEGDPKLVSKDAWITPTKTGTYVEPLSAEMLRRVGGLSPDNELSDLRSISLVVDSRIDACDALGELAPCLECLDLRDSVLTSLRDLGTSLSRLRVLRAPCVGLKELDGVGALGCLEELYLPFNDIWDLSALALHDNIQASPCSDAHTLSALRPGRPPPTPQVLDLEGNQVGEVLQVAQLGTCPRLWALTLSGNPIARRCTPDEYRRLCVQHVRVCGRRGE